MSIFKNKAAMAMLLGQAASGMPNKNEKLRKKLSPIVTRIISNIYWTMGSHGILPPHFDLPTFHHLTRDEKGVVKNAIVRLLNDEPLTWTGLLIVAFETNGEVSISSTSLRSEDTTLNQLGDDLKETCESAIQLMVDAEDDPAFSMDTVKHYGLFLAPADDYNFEVMEDSMMDSFYNEDCFKQYQWEDRIDYNKDDFIKSIQDKRF